MIIIGAVGIIGAFGFLITACNYINLETKRVENESSALELKHDYNNWLKSQEESGDMTTDDAAKHMAYSDETYKGDMSFMDQIADAMGLSSKTAIWILAGIIGFSLLKG